MFGLINLSTNRKPIANDNQEEKRQHSNKNQMSSLAVFFESDHAIMKNILVPNKNRSAHLASHFWQYLLQLNLLQVFPFRNICLQSYL